MSQNLNLCEEEKMGSGGAELTSPCTQSVEKPDPGFC